MLNQDILQKETALSFSLLWPSPEHYLEWLNRDYPLKDDLVKDIRLDKICSKIQVNYNYSFLISQMSQVISNKETILYRRDFLKDILKYPWLKTVINSIRKIISVIEDESSIKFNKGSALQVSLWRIQKISHIYDFCKILYQQLNPQGLKNHEITGYSAVLMKLYRMADLLLHGHGYMEIRQEIETVLEEMSRYQNVKVMLDMRRNKCFITFDDTGEELLYTKITGEADRKNVPVKRGTFSFPLFDAILNVIRIENPGLFDTILELGRKIESIEHIYETFKKFGQELDFYESALELKNLYDQLELPCCLPELADGPDNRVTSLKSFYDPVMAIHLAEEGKFSKEAIVTNDIDLSGPERIAIITGPNQGGKTTWLRAVTLCQVLFQAGFFIPAERAVLSVKDWIFTHFPADEKMLVSQGRLREEALRMKTIFQHITANSMVMMNESFSSTNAIDGLNILCGLMKALRTVGATAALATHLHEILDMLEDINSVPADTNVIRLTACVEADIFPYKKNSTKRTYKILKNIASSGSYALDIAKMFGADPDSIRQVIADKTQVPAEVDHD